MSQVYPSERKRSKNKSLLVVEQSQELTLNASQVPSQIRLITKSQDTTPIIKHSNERYDAKGTKIVKGSKKHVVTFKRRLNEVYVVENWKIFNIVDDEEEEERTCPCSLI